MAQQIRMMQRLRQCSRLGSESLSRQREPIRRDWHGGERLPCQMAECGLRKSQGLRRWPSPAHLCVDPGEGRRSRTATPRLLRWRDRVSPRLARRAMRSEEHPSELQSLMRIQYAVFCLKKKNKQHNYNMT